MAVSILSRLVLAATSYYIWLERNGRLFKKKTSPSDSELIMNPQETLQAIARDEKWVPSAERVKISSTNIRLETTQFWYTIKKVPDTDSYEFLLANKKCIVNAEVFRTILDICPRVEGVDFTDVPDDDTTLTFLIDHDTRIPPKNRRGKGSKGRKVVDDSQETIDVSEESEPKPEPTKKKSASRRVVKKRVTLSRSSTESPCYTCKDHAESVPESTKKKSSGRSSKSVIIHDTLSAPKSKPATLKTKLKGAPSLTPAEQEAANIMQALKESKKTSRRQPGTRGSNEGASSKPRVPDKSTVISAASNEGNGAKPGVLDEDKDITKEKVIFEWGYEQDSEHSDDDNDDAEKDDKDGDADDEGDDHVSDTQDVDDEDVETEFDKDDIYKYKIRVHKDEDVEMKDAKVEGSDKGDEEIIDAAKEEAEKTSEAKDDTKKTELPPSSSSLSVSLSFGDQFLKLSFDSSLVSTVKDSVDADVSSLLDIPIQHETPQIQSPSVKKIPVSVILETTNLPPIPEIVTETPVITVDPHLIVAKLEKVLSELKTVDHSSEALAVLQSYVLTVVDSYLDTKVGDHLPGLTKKPTPTAEQEFEKSPSKILKIKKEQAKSQKNP
ncbi:hypothetical protein Tco_0324945 [Tanacetum coccineum]